MTVRQSSVIYRRIGWAGWASVMLAAALAAATYAGSFAPRATVEITGEPDLLRAFATGLVGDAFGYDAFEVWRMSRALNMPVADMVPVFQVAHLSGRSFLDVAETAAMGRPWGEICEALGVGGEDINGLLLPPEVEVLKPADVPDHVLKGFFLCSVLAKVFDFDPAQALALLERGWDAQDVMAAVTLAHRSRRPVESWLSGQPREVNWMREADRLGVGLEEVARTAGRCYDNDLPRMSNPPLRGDQELVYALELVADRWGVPPQVARRARWAYLYSPSELLISCYLAVVSGCDVHRVGQLYAQVHWRDWAPTIRDLRIPPSRFANLGWPGRSLDAMAPYELHKALLAEALSSGPRPTPTVIVWQEPWFMPRDAIFGVWVHEHYYVPCEDYYKWRRSGRAWHEYRYCERARGDWSRSLSRVSGRTVGIVEGQHEPAPRPSWYPSSPRPSGPAPRPQVPVREPATGFVVGGDHVQVRPEIRVGPPPGNAQVGNPDRQRPASGGTAWGAPSAPTPRPQVPRPSSSTGFVVGNHEASPTLPVPSPGPHSDGGGSAVTQPGSFTVPPRIPAAPGSDWSWFLDQTPATPQPSPFSLPSTVPGPPGGNWTWSLESSSSMGTASPPVWSPPASARPGGSSGAGYVTGSHSNPGRSGSVSGGSAAPQGRRRR